MKKITIIFFLAIAKLIGQNTPLFEYISSKKSKIDFINKLKATENENFFIYDNFYQGAGVGLGDVNNDGLLDIYFCGNQEKDRLYINKGNFVFDDITKESGIADLDTGWSSSVSMIDINNDGLLDIYVTKELYDDKPEWRRNRLYLNKGSNKFTEVAEKVGLGDTTRTRGAAFLDYDLDGDLDVFLLRQPPNPGMYSKYKPLSDKGELTSEKYAPHLYENKEGVFYDVSKEANILSPSYANAVAVGDFNKDGYPDIAVANDFEAPDALYINQGNKTFENTSNTAYKHTSYYSMGTDVADLNNDSFLDVFTVDMVANDNFRLKSNMSGMNPDKFWKTVNKGWNYQYMYNTLQLNNGNGTFSEIGQLAGTSSTDWSWTPLMADFDNDGLKDIFVTNGILRDIRNTDADFKIKQYISKKIQDYLKTKGNLDYSKIWDVVDYDEMANIYPSTKMQNKSFKNINGYQLQDVSNDWGIDKKTFSSGAAYGDLDNDGDLDIVINNVNEVAHVLKNNSKNNFLRIILINNKTTSVFGAKATIYFGSGKSQFVETTSTRGMFSTSEPYIHFGLGSNEAVDSLIVVWPNLKQSKLYNPTINQTIKLSSDKALDVKEGVTKKENHPFFVDQTKLSKIKFIHKENDFDDFKYQVLLPHKLSQFGPALAIDDVNNDGLKDVYVGGAAGFSGQLFIQNHDGNFESSPIATFENDRYSEDLDAVFLDVDKDGDQDLYVVSGGNEYEKGDDSYKDRLYINDGKGNFLKDTKGLNSECISGSVAVPADFDGDGDLDIFVGGRLSPHDYPSPTNSQLLENWNGKLIDVTKKKAPELLDIGMVTDAIWSDFDNDNDLDLIVVGEWMPITVFRNNDGNFSKEIIPSLANTEGWWFSIEQGDFDNDGDLDFIAGNLGLNYKYKASEEAPFDVYYGDFDGNNSNDIVLGYYQKNKHYPVRGFSCSSQQVPELKHDIKKYDIFASLEIQDIYGEKKLDKALYYKAQTFATSFIENLGNNEFKISKLPVEAQFSSVNDIVVEDFNLDGNLDVVLVGNLFVSEIETTRNDAGTGLLLLGNGDTSFRALNHSETGLFANNDAKKAKLLKDGNQKLILIANNNDVLQVFKVGEYDNHKTN